MKKFVPFLLVATLITANLSCDKEENESPTDTPKRTVIIYMAGDNALSNMVTSNIDSIKNNLEKTENRQNLVIFADKKDHSPLLLKVTPQRIDTLKVFDELNSADAATLSMVIKYVKDNYKTDSYGLLLWGHGMGWLPFSQLHNVADNIGFAPMRTTRTFALEMRPNERPSYTSMEIDDMVNAIPDGLFEYIAFDACYMGCVEIMYALRNKARYILSCCSEVISDGYPYQNVTSYLLDANLTEVCNGFYNYYNSMTGWEQMGDISLVKTEGLDSLAGCFKKIMAEYRQNISQMNVDSVQCFDIYKKHVYYDLEDYLVKLGTKTEYLNEFRTQMEKCVIYRKSTQYMFPGLSFREFEIKTYSGMSVYIPRQEYESSGLNAEYSKTEWYQHTN